MKHELSKELLERTIADWEAARDEIPFGLGEEGDNTLAALKFALVAHEQEPVGEVFLGEHDVCGDYPDVKVLCIAADGQADWNNFKEGTKLFLNPAPSIPAAVPEEATEEDCPAFIKYEKIDVAESWAAGHNAYTD